MSETLPRLKAEATLPSGKKIVMRELDGSDELLAAAESGDGEGRAARLRLNWGLLKRAVTHLDGSATDQAITPEAFRKLFTAKDMTAVQELYDRLHGVGEKELGDFRSSIRISA
jgi:hypothetical protein